MLPSVLAAQLQRGLSDYIETTFPMTNPVFRGSIKRFLDTPKAVFHEPYINVHLPFRIAEEDGTDQFTAIHPQFKPYVHQKKAYDRILGDNGKSTLIATGTGSGKTECFLYPVLEYCYRRRGEPGIKALIVYPMNALAADQAKRIAELIYNSPELKGNVTAGMYVGGHDLSASRLMGEHQIITNHETMRASPPDILLTNYKMLDYLLVRPIDAIIWRDNNPETLKHIAVDELHTFDGAQGTDLACLLRRLKSRLLTPEGYLCCIGTSATMGSDESAESIRHYATEVFGEQFDDASVITEDRLSPAEFIAGREATDFTLPTAEQASILHKLIETDDVSVFLEQAFQSWFSERLSSGIETDEGRVELSGKLLTHSFTQSLLLVLNNGYKNSTDLFEELISEFPQLNDIGSIEAALYALFALISHARIKVDNKLRPFLTVQTQLWFRELRRLLAKVSDTPEYAIAADLNDITAKQYLPVVNCRDCGETGWVSISNERGNVTLNDLSTFYNLYFTADDHIKMMFPGEHKKLPEKMMRGRLCTHCLQLQIGEEAKSTCPSCGSSTIQIILPIDNPTTSSQNSKQYVCPFCGSRRGLALIGLRSATSISASISQLFASRFNDDKKTLAFSDNVQDAAHRAGFFNARTWRFALRSAIQRYALNGGEGKNLEDFSNGFIEYWLSKLSLEEFIGRFIAPNMTWMHAYEDLVEKGHFDETSRKSQDLLRDIKKRLKYEIMLEYGLTSRIGRTLEKSGCSTVGFNLKDILALAEIVKERVINELGTCRETDDASFNIMVLGFLNTIRQNGAFNDPVFSDFIDKGDSWLISADRISWMPGRQSGRNIPRFISDNKITGKGRNAFDTIASKKYFEWIRACMGEILISDELIVNIGKIMLEEANKDKLISFMHSEMGHAIYGLNKEAIFISNNVIQAVCNTCGTSLSIAVENKSIWENSPCQRSTCSGHYHFEDTQEIDYYGKLYSSGDIVRVVAEEHTGLLERTNREEIENIFKRSQNEQKSWDVNVLSCTPTLEMGIDIGDLSTVIMCSIPPGQAQFLQRAGRAGRKDGNALTVAVANARPHDLFFYNDPRELFSGKVEPPKIFLKASAVLERQFVAFCMDNWVKSGIPESSIPKKIYTCLVNIEKRAKGIFPYNFLEYSQNNLTVLFNNFIGLFSNDFSDVDLIQELKQYAFGDGEHESQLSYKIYASFLGLKKERDVIHGNIKQLTVLIKELKSRPKDSSFDQQIADLEKEQRALAGVLNGIHAKDIFNFLCDEGLLPNYTFPEAGIILKAILRRKQQTEDNDSAERPSDKRKAETVIYEYSRPAASALSEFAPNNSFYVEGKKLTIDQIDINTSQPENWRLCPNCSHTQLEEHGKDVASCPSCGSPAWADAGQRRTMLKVQMVYSNTDYNKSFAYDESDDRSTRFYCKQLLVDVNEDTDITKAYQMNNNDFEFGYEFVKKAVMREINFGENDIIGDKLTVAGLEYIRKGFKICKSCGKIQDGDNPKHSTICPENKKSGTEPFTECLFLYREFATEAIRLLIPATTMDETKVKQESFTAAFMLGMKEYFGNVDHLRACISEVPMPETSYKKQYLVIYDSVPGGTGYLKQLIQDDPKENINTLISIFEKALHVLENCKCKDDPQKDGCYHCLFAYRQSRNIGQISRKIAIKLLQSILQGKKNIKPIQKIANIEVNHLFDSELEQRFIEALGRMNNDSRIVQIEKALVKNKPGYRLSVDGNIWEIEPQVDLNKSNNIVVNTRADFVLWPSPKLDKLKPVAIYTDGFLYHKDKVADDTLKRNAIIQSGKFRVWVLSWKDVDSAFRDIGSFVSPMLDYRSMPTYGQFYNHILQTKGETDLRANEKSQLELLIEYLSNSNAESRFTTQAKAYSFSMLRGDITKFEDWIKKIRPLLQTFGISGNEISSDSVIFGSWMPKQDYSLNRVYSYVLMTDFSQLKTEAPCIIISLLDDTKESRTVHYEEEWNGFWHFFNIMQFLEGYKAVSQIGIELSVYTPLIQVFEQTKAAEPSVIIDEAWKDSLEYMVEEAKPIVKKLISLGVRAPSATGYELANEAGAIIAEAEIAWIENRIVFLTDIQKEFAQTFTVNGWKVITKDSELTIDIFNGEL
jgi:DEAD/DEAH box helicase domain-containing protein